MSIIKNEIPILEFDTEQTAVISPVHENLNLVLPKKCVFAFLGEYIDEYAEKTGAQIVSYFISMTKEYPVYITTYKGALPGTGGCRGCDTDSGLADWIWSA